MHCSACENPIPNAMMYSWCEHQDCHEPVCIRCTTTGPMDRDALYEQSKSGKIATVCCKQHNVTERFMDTLPEAKTFPVDRIYARRFLTKTFTKQ